MPWEECAAIATAALRANCAPPTPTTVRVLCAGATTLELTRDGPPACYETETVGVGAVPAGAAVRPGVLAAARRLACPAAGFPCSAELQNAETVQRLRLAFGREAVIDIEHVEPRDAVEPRRWMRVRARLYRGCRFETACRAAACMSREEP